ncbi:hypothetical protein HPS54_01115 [Prevotella sp. PCHR]|uniref:Uncharacterized protein n=1 Tax=Xylanibacter caecicola TaxID=2736294 RepID=A0ABX2B141_9BACT|nr:hypothetical protein [Xylanibacter caecicola]NPE24127.1 hypothetical protein [Xylanibacter caecicola]
MDETCHAVSDAPWSIPTGEKALFWKEIKGDKGRYVACATVDKGQMSLNKQSDIRLLSPYIFPYLPLSPYSIFPELTLIIK